MRLLFRLIVLALAAFGAKALYDWLAPRREDLQRTGADFASRATSAAREVTGVASDAARHMAKVASDDASGLADTAAQQVQEVKAAAGEAKAQAVETLGSPAGDEPVADAAAPKASNASKSTSTS